MHNRRKSAAIPCTFSWLSTARAHCGAARNSDA